MPNIKFSIITVCLNSEKTIKRCLDSVESQSFRDFEHIVIDGMSNDNTLNIVSEYNNVICISENDKGIYDAMNKGVKYASGKYVLFLNSDDELLEDFLHECNIEAGEVDFISSGINMIFEDRTRVWKAESLMKTNFIWRMPMPHAGLIVKKEVFNAIGGFDLSFKLSSDFDFVVKLLKAKYFGVYNKKCSLNFYMGGVSQTYISIKENHRVRLNHFDNIFLIYFAYFLDNLRFIRGKFF